MVFTIPKRLRVFFRYDRRLLGELAGCAWRALSLYLDAYFESAEVRPGAIGFISTSGELLRFHPHLHLQLADGGWLPDGTFRHLTFFDTAAVQPPRRWSTTSWPGGTAAFRPTARCGSRAGETLLAWVGT